MKALMYTIGYILGSICLVGSLAAGFIGLSRLMSSIENIRWISAHPQHIAGAVIMTWLIIGLVLGSPFWASAVIAMTEGAIAFLAIAFLSSNIIHDYEWDTAMAGGREIPTMDVGMEIALFMCIFLVCVAAGLGYTWLFADDPEETTPAT